MPALGNIAIADGKAAPVTHTFAPVTTDGYNASLANRAALIPQGFETLDVKVRKPASANGAYRIDVEMTFPVVATVNGLDQVVRSSKALLTIYESSQGSEADRKDHRVLLANLLGNSTIATVIEKLEPIY